MSFDDLDNHLPLLAIEPKPQRLSAAPNSIPLVHTRISTSRRRNRPTPYPQPQHSLYQLNITYLDPVRVQELVEIVRPRSPRHALAAVLEPPPRGLHVEALRDNGNINRRPVHWVLAIIIDLVETVTRVLQRV